jgi:hypothetical protein
MTTPAKRVLQETTNIHLSPQDSIKKRKLDVPSRFAKGDENKILSSQPKSSFEEHLEQLSQDLTGLKQANAEKDQKWARPSLDGFNPAQDDITFQQIEVEEGTIHNGKQTLRLFGVTEVSNRKVSSRIYSNSVILVWSLCSPTCHRVSTLLLHCRSTQFPERRLQRISNIP